MGIFKQRPNNAQCLTKFKDSTTIVYKHQHTKHPKMERQQFFTILTLVGFSASD